MKYVIKSRGEYLRDRYGSDCFTDDLGHAILFDNREQAEAWLMSDEEVVVIQEDDEGGIWEEQSE